MRKVRIQTRKDLIEQHGLTPVQEIDDRNFGPVHQGPCACSSCEAYASDRQRTTKRVWRSQEAIPKDLAYIILCSQRKNFVTERYLLPPL
jgi:hypothetical protein